jgi:hypothetical protein
MSTRIRIGLISLALLMMSFIFGVIAGHQLLGSVVFMAFLSMCALGAGIFMFNLYMHIEKEEEHSKVLANQQQILANQEKILSLMMETKESDQCFQRWQEYLRQKEKQEAELASKKWGQTSIFNLLYLLLENVRDMQLELTGMCPAYSEGSPETVLGYLKELLVRTGAILDELQKKKYLS